MSVRVLGSSLEQPDEQITRALLGALPCGGRWTRRAGRRRRTKRRRRANERKTSRDFPNSSRCPPPTARSCVRLSAFCEERRAQSPQSRSSARNMRVSGGAARLAPHQNRSSRRAGRSPLTTVALLKRLDGRDITWLSKGNDVTIHVAVETETRRDGAAACICSRQHHDA